MTRLADGEEQRGMPLKDREQKHRRAHIDHAAILKKSKTLPHTGNLAACGSTEIWANQLTLSLKTWAALNTGVLLAAISIVSPLAGLRP